MALLVADARVKTTRLLVLAAFVLSGATALMYQVVWSRLLQTILSSTVYTTSAILASFLLGLSCGSFLCRLRAVSDPRPLCTMAIILIGIGAYGLVFHVAVGGIEALSLRLPSSLVIRVLLAMLLLTPPAALFGALWPYASHYFKDDSGMGRLYSANSWGAAFGALTAGFVFIPLFGFRHTGLLAATLNFIGAFFLLVARPRI